MDADTVVMLETRDNDMTGISVMVYEAVKEERRKEKSLDLQQRTRKSRFMPSNSVIEIMKKGPVKFNEIFLDVGGQKGKGRVANLTQDLAERQLSLKFSMKWQKVYTAFIIYYCLTVMLWNVSCYAFCGRNESHSTYISFTVNISAQRRCAGM